MSWNAVGHQVIAEIAYHHLNKKAQISCDQYNHAKNKRQSFIKSAVWLDTLYAPKYQHMRCMHFIDIPFTTENTPLPKIKGMNALVAIRKSHAILINPDKSQAQKKLALRILLHVVGDIHQPLHTATKVSTKFPLGDKGGNLFSLKHNPVANNLHAYWDRGGGYLILSHAENRKSRDRKKTIIQLSKQLEEISPCNVNLVSIDPLQWVEESHNLAVIAAYKISPNTSPSKAYQQEVIKISKKQLAMAGCRLASLLNHALG